MKPYKYYLGILCSALFLSLLHVIQVNGAAYLPALGGTGNSTTPRKGDLLVGSSSQIYARVATGTQGYVLKVSGTAPYGISWEPDLNTGGSGGGLVTSSLGIYTDGKITFFVNSNTVSATSSPWINSSTGAFYIGGPFNASGTITQNGISLVESSTLWGLVVNSSSLAHAIATLSGENYLSLSGQAFTAGTINDTNLTAEDFGEFTCDSNEDGCTLDDTVTVNGWTLGNYLFTNATGTGGLTADVLKAATYAVVGTTTRSTSTAIFQAGVGTSTFVILNNGAVGIGTSDPQKWLSSARWTVEDEDGSNSDFLFRVAGNGNPLIRLAKSQGTLAAPVTSTDGDTLGQIEFRGFADGQYLTGVSIAANVMGTPVSGFTTVPSELQFSVANNTDGQISALTIVSSGTLKLERGPFDSILRTDTTGHIGAAPGVTSGTIPFGFVDPTSTAPYGRFGPIKLDFPVTFSKFDCAESAAATTTIAVYLVPGITSTAAASHVISSIQCGINGNATTTFVDSTLTAGQYVLFRVTSTNAGTPTQTVGNLTFMKTF